MLREVWDILPAELLDSDTVRGGPLISAGRILLSSSASIPSNSRLSGILVVELDFMLAEVE